MCNPVLELTIDVHCGEDDTVKGRNGGKKQSGCYTGIPEPVHLLSKDTGCYEHIVTET